MALKGLRMCSSLIHFNFSFFQELHLCLLGIQEEDTKRLLFFLPQKAKSVSQISKKKLI